MAIKIKNSTIIDDNRNIIGVGFVGIGTTSTDQLFQVGTASSIVIIDSMGDLGIGTTNPTSRLQVVPISTGIAGLFSGTTSSDMVRITQLGTGNALVVEDETNPDATPFVVTGIGSVGIGTTNPTSTLQVQGTVSVSSTTTSAEFVGGGSDLRNLSGTHLVSYASASDISNSALSISGISSYSQVGILTGSLAVNANDNFGISVATSADGKTIIVGARSDEIGATTSTGVVYVYDRIGNSFNQVGILTGSLAVDATDNFGRSVATSADGKTIIVGANFDEIGATTSTGVVYVYDRIGNSFNQVGILTGSLAVNASDNFGISVATSADGKTIIVGANVDEIGATTDTGVVYVYDRIGNSFNQVGILTGSLAVDTNDNFGWSVATSADGKTIIVGASADEIGATTSTGVVYVYDRIGNSFNQVGILTGSLAALAVNASDFFGTSVATSADGKTIIVGANIDEIGATTDTGVVYVYDRIGNSFNEVGILTGSLAVNANDNFGFSVATSADGKTIIVGANADEIGATTSTGVAYIFKRQGNSFNQVGILTGSLAVDTTDNFGFTVATSADGKTIIVSANADEIGATTGTGVVYVFDEIRDTYVYSGPTGNIGIGTTNPKSKLQVSGDINIDDGGTFTTVLQVVTPTANRTISLPDRTGTVALVAGSDSQVTFNSAGINSGAQGFNWSNVNGLTATLPIINSYTGLANTSAVYLSGSWSSATGSKPQFLIEPSGTTSSGWGNAGTALGLNSPSGFTGNYVDIKKNGTSYLIVTGTGTTTIINSALNTLSLQTNSLDRVAITTSGDVGVGTTNPGARVQVGSAITESVFITSSGDILAGTNTLYRTGGRSLHIRGTAASSANYGSISLENQSDGGGVTAGTVDFYTSGQHTAQIKGEKGTGGSSGNGRIYFNVQNSSASLKQVLFVDQNTVDLGTANGTNSAYLRVFSNSAGTTTKGIQLGNMQTSSGSNIDIDFIDYQSSPYAAIRGIYSGPVKTGDIGFFTYNGITTASERLRVNAGGAVLIGSATSTGTASQTLQVTGGAYVSGNVGIGTTNPQYTLQVVGSFGAITKSFIIPHPTKPNYKLRYGSLESPYHGIRLTGIGTIKNGQSTVNLPDYISALVRNEEINIQITNIKHGKILWVEDVDVENNKFVIMAEEKSGQYNFYWDFTAIRNDVEKIVVEYEDL